ncbi:BON domain-containing protein [Hymenobacter sp. H14-R3]|uniref:BON domain-containing protein n=1 Tax=Hymenobacter sp. H14-R3 TaxID=3046308 RepID=UPI0024BBE325|nr:BON domain-containing protein [Hymenobacter sp. H14-R3]MDJ0366713.1 BON domain-containing protein [Hymenobacter sp. H14-R3]
MHMPVELPTTEARLADADILTAVARLFAQPKGVGAARIATACREGIVELTGFTDSLLARQRAAELVKAIRGVRGVLNELCVRTPHVPDGELRRRVQQALALAPAVRSYAVDCRACAGAVTVEGIVQSWAEVQLVLQVLFGVPGLRQVHNHLVVRGGALNNSDAEITTQIQAFLAWDIRVVSARVEVLTSDGIVYLTGAVGSAAEHDQVVATAYVAGARCVKASELHVAYWAQDPALSRQKFTPPADAEVAQAIQDAFRYDPRLGSLLPTVQVRAGVVTLLGTLSNLRARQAAEQDARNVVGTCQVHNLLKVRSTRPEPDAHIQAQVQAALLHDPYVSHRSFEVRVTNGRVQLAGVVADHFDRERAADVAAGINGVVEVANHVHLAAAPGTQVAPDTGEAVPPTQVPFSREGVNAQLAQRLHQHYQWSALLHSQPIELGVRAGRVTLSGTVGSWLARQQAVSGAYACGATEVNNHLRILAAKRESEGLPKLVP